MSDTYKRLANLLGALALTLTDDMNRALAEAAGQAGEAPAAILELAGNPGMTVDALRRRLNLSHSAVVRLLDRLDERGLLIRQRGTADARTVSLALTDQGHAVAAAVAASRATVLDQALTSMTPEQQDRLEGLIEALLAGWPAAIDHCFQICRLCDTSSCPADRCPVEARYLEFSG